MQRVICGHAALANERYRHVFQRVMRRLVGFIEGGMMPSTDVADPVQWRPREYNARVDYLCNQALDTRSPFFLDEQVDAYRIDGCSLGMLFGRSLQGR